MSVKPIALAIALWLGLAGQGHAQSCTFSNTGLDFGSIVLSGRFQTTTGTLTANCSGTPGRTIRICANFNAGSGGVAAGGRSRYLVSGSNRIRYNLFQNNGVNQVWGSYTWPYSARPPSISLNLASNGIGSVSQTINGRLYNRQVAAAPGAYISLFSGTNTQIDYGYAPGFSCSSTLSSRIHAVPFNVRATNAVSCTVSTTLLDFGTQPSLATARTSSNTIAVTCTPGASYAIGLSNGQTGTGPTARRMTNTATTQFITYGIYRDAAYSLPWGNTTGSDTASATGTGVVQNFTGYARIPVQTTPRALVYTDTIVVTVTY